MKKGDTRRRYSPEFKQDAIKLAENIGVGEDSKQAGYTSQQLTKMEISKKHSHRKIPRCLETSKRSQTA